MKTTHDYPMFAGNRREFAGYLMGAAAATQRLLNAQAPKPAESPEFVISPSEITYLMADRSKRSGTLSVKREGSSDVKRFWVEQWRDPLQFFQWNLQVSEAGEYEVTIMVSAPAGTRIQLRGSRSSLTCETTWIDKYGRGYNWDRIRLQQPLSLSTGESSLQIQLQNAVEGRAGAALKSVELLNVKERPAMDVRVAAFHSDARWLGRAKFGFMCQCGEWSYPRHGAHKPWPQMVEQFNIQRFADMVDETGAGYVVWSATWATYFFPAPIAAIDHILPGRTSKRDFIGELADELRKRNMALILYYHAGHDTTPENGSWWSKNWVSQDDKALFFDNWCSIISEIGERYGDRLAGWMFDDELLYYPAPYERLGKAAKAGSRSRILSYNSWIQARGTDFEDFQFGEGFMGDERVTVGGSGIWTEGPMKGLEAHGNFQLDGPNWGINHPDTAIVTRFTSERALAIAMDAASRNEALSWNLLMYDDGSVSESSLEVLRSAGRAVRAKYPRP